MFARREDVAIDSPAQPRGQAPAPREHRPRLIGNDDHVTVAGPRFASERILETSSLGHDEAHVRSRGELLAGRFQLFGRELTLQAVSDPRTEVAAAGPHLFYDRYRHYRQRCAHLRGDLVSHGSHVARASAVLDEGQHVATQGSALTLHVRPPSVDRLTVASTRAA